MGYEYDEKTGRKVYVHNLFAVLFAMFAIIFVLAFILNAIFPKNSEPVETDTKVSAAEYGYYPGRQSGDYNDIVFDFDSYLNDKGATNVQRYVYRKTESEIIMELQFDLNGDHYDVKTSDLCGYVATTLVVTHKGKDYIVEDPGLGRHIYDSSSPLWMNATTFDVLHVITDNNTDFYYGNYEGDCPFRNLGIAHWSYDDNGKVFWHDDFGTERYDLHY